METEGNWILMSSQPLKVPQYRETGQLDFDVLSTGQDTSGQGDRTTGFRRPVNHTGLRGGGEGERR